MKDRAPSTIATGNPIGVVTREVRTRILNLSTSGCLIETNARVEVGATGSLTVEVAGLTYVDDVQVTRCQAIEGAGSMYRVGTRFLWTVPPGEGTLRSVLGRLQSGTRTPRVPAE